MINLSLRRKISAALVVTAVTLSLGTQLSPAEAAAPSAGQLRHQLQRLDGSRRNELQDAMRKQYGVTTDRALNARLDRLMAELTRAVARTDPSILSKPYSYFITRQQGFNAICSLGHNLAVTPQIMTDVACEDETAFILAHEIAHGQKKHLLQSLKSPQAASLTVTSDEATLRQEEEADSLAFSYLLSSSFNPGAAAAIWQRRLEAAAGKAAPPKKRGTHPSPEQRRNYFARRLSSLCHGQVQVKDGAVFLKGQLLLKPAAAENASGAERAWLAAGLLSRAYAGIDGLHSYASAEGNTVYFAGRPFFYCSPKDIDAATLVNRLNTIR